ncbi:unnamed protein product [Paramecium sonneborni]|uniref:Uncharacterized protein n=1 Tax=Paramecium sonneborni TaxID=65129 RepID=A0A8S1RSY6_9CILI|nr:unnamed protein product [Paramecium sonneborni]
MEKGKFNGTKMIHDIKESFLKMNQMEKVYTILEIMKFTNDNSRMEKCMGMGSLNGQMEKFIKEIIIQEENKDLESLLHPIEFIQENGIMECIMDMENQKIKIK